LGPTTQPALTQEAAEYSSEGENNDVEACNGAKVTIDEDSVTESDDDRK